MATGKVEDGIWPMPKYNYNVTWGSTKMTFSHVHGLSAKSQSVGYRNQGIGGSDPLKMRTLTDLGVIILKQGVFAEDDSFLDWYSKFQFDTGKTLRETVLIERSSDNGESTVSWTLKNAYPIKITTGDMNANSSEAAIDTVEVDYETLVINT